LFYDLTESGMQSTKTYTFDEAMAEQQRIADNLLMEMGHRMPTAEKGERCRQLKAEFAVSRGKETRAYLSILDPVSGVLGAVAELSGVREEVAKDQSNYNVGYSIRALGGNTRNNIQYAETIGIAAAIIELAVTGWFADKLEEAAKQAAEVWRTWLNDNQVLFS
jgi:hypothetical protein